MLRSADPLVTELCLEHWRTSTQSITAKYRAENTKLLQTVESFLGFKTPRLSRVRRFHLVRLREWIEHSAGPRKTVLLADFDCLCNRRGSQCQRHVWPPHKKRTETQVRRCYSSRKMWSPSQRQKEIRTAELH
jgi:hypothetical protein